MTIEETLNDYQKIRIKELMKLDFFIELEKSKNCLQRKKFSKNFKAQLDLFINELHNEGVMFYGFTIKRVNFEFETEDYVKNKWYYTYLRVEDLVNFFKENIELIEFCYISIESNDCDNKSTLNRLPFHGIIGVRSLIGNNLFHFNQIKKILDNPIDDVEIIKLDSVNSIINHWNFVIKQNNFKFHRFTHYSIFYDEFYGIMSDLELQYDKVDHIAFSLDENCDSKYSYIKGISDSNPDNEIIINYLFTIYMLEENLYLCDNKLYKKLSDKNHEIIGSIDYLRKNNLLIIEKLKKKFPQQLGGLNISKLFNRGWNKFFKDIKENNHYLPSFDSVEIKLIN